jgi:hypothetical protein
MVFEGKNFLLNCGFEVFYFTYFINYLQNVEPIGEGVHGSIFSCKHKELYNKETVCVKIKKPNDNINLFLSEFAVGRFFRKFIHYYYFDIIIEFSKSNFIVNYYDKISSEDNKYMGIVLEYLNYKVIFF